MDEFLTIAANADSSDDGLALRLVLADIATACKKIAIAIRQGAISGTMGELDAQNIQGEQQKQLDVVTNDIFLEACQISGYVAGLASEEMEEPFAIPSSSRQNGRYLVLFDPLDGSSNVNVNISVGTIFSILRCPAHIQNPQKADFLQVGTQQICAGYALYGTSTMLVFTTGNGVNGYSLDHDTQAFRLTHPGMRIPADTSEFAINMSNQRFWEAPVQHYIAECLQGEEGSRGKDFNMRWVASMVAEVHRILIRGGVFLYPLDSRIKHKVGKDSGGKLRLMYEANPMAFIVEQAGGLATTGHARILDIQPDQLHQRIPVMLGAEQEIQRLIALHAAQLHQETKT